MTAITPTSDERTLPRVRKAPVRSSEAHVAVSDCERIRPGLIAQPVNTASSGAYCAAGAWLLCRRPQSRGRRTLGLAAIGAGVGSVAYHGPGGRAARLVHDVSAAALGSASVVVLLARPVSVSRRAATLTLASVGLVVHAASRSDRILCRPDSPWQGHALWHVIGAAAVAMAGS
jgi:hypothetical protein